jgi:hypothetical protein
MTSPPEYTEGAGAQAQGYADAASAFAAGMADCAEDQAPMYDPMGGAEALVAPYPMQQPYIPPEKGPDEGQGGVT